MPHKTPVKNGRAFGPRGRPERVGEPPVWAAADRPESPGEDPRDAVSQTGSRRRAALPVFAVALLAALAVLEVRHG